MTLRSWLCRAPHPSLIRAETAGGDDRIVRIGSTRSKWRDAEKALANCVRAEAVDEQGAVLRVWESAEADASSGVSRGASSQSELATFASLLADSCDRAVERYHAAYALSFEHQSALVSVMSARLSQLEKAWHQLLMSLQNQQAENAEDPNASLVQGIVMAALGGGQHPPPPPPPPKANGKA